MPCGAVNPYIMHSANSILVLSFKIMGSVLKNQKILIGLDTFLFMASF